MSSRTGTVVAGTAAARTAAARTARPADALDGTEERILAAAELCLARYGMSRLSMTDVATQAGISRGGVYLHFADRRTLIDAVLTRAATRFVASSAESISRRRTLVAQVAEAAVFIREHLGDSMLTLRLPADEESLLATLLTSRLERMVEDWVEFWLPYLAAAEVRGELRPGVDHRQAAEWIVRMMLSFAVMPAVSFDADRPEQVRAFVRSFIVDGLGSGPAQDPAKGGKST
jgi:AcrR family transcriptional regulator